MLQPVAARATTAMPASAAARRPGRPRRRGRSGSGCAARRAPACAVGKRHCSVDLRVEWVPGQCMRLHHGMQRRVVSRMGRRSNAGPRACTTCRSRARRMAPSVHDVPLACAAEHRSSARGSSAPDVARSSHHRLIDRRPPSVHDVPLAFAARVQIVGGGGSSAPDVARSSPDTRINTPPRCHDSPRAARRGATRCRPEHRESRISHLEAGAGRGGEEGRVPGALRRYSAGGQLSRSSTSTGRRNRPRRSLPPLEPVDDRPDRGTPELPHRLVHGRQPRAREPSGVDAVEPRHHQVVRHPEPAGPRRVEHPERGLVVRADDRPRHLGTVEQPRRELPRSGPAEVTVHDPHGPGRHAVVVERACRNPAERSMSSGESIARRGTRATGSRAGRSRATRGSASPAALSTLTESNPCDRRSSASTTTGHGGRRARAGRPARSGRGPRARRPGRRRR